MHKRGKGVHTNSSSLAKGEEHEHREEQRPEEELLSSFLFDHVQFVVVSQRTGHFLIRHVISILLNKDHYVKILSR